MFVGEIYANLKSHRPSLIHGNVDRTAIFIVVSRHTYSRISSPCSQIAATGFILDRSSRQTGFPGVTKAFAAVSPQWTWNGRYLNILS